MGFFYLYTMKYIALSIVLSFSSTFLYSQTYSNLYNHPFNENGDYLGLSIDFLDDTLYVFGGIVVANPNWTSHIFMNKFNTNGAFVSDSYFDPEHQILDGTPGLYGSIDSFTHEDSTFFTIAYMEYLGGIDSLIESENLLFISKEGQEISRSELEWNPYGKSLHGARTIGLNEHLVYGNAWDEGGMFALSDSGFLLNCNSQGETNWVHRYDSISHLRFMDVFPDGSAIIGASIYWAGTTGGGPFNTSDQVILRTNSLGEEQWRHIFGGIGEQTVCPVTADSNGNILTLGLRGTADSPQRGELWFKKIQDNGTDYDVINESIMNEGNILRFVPYGIKQLSARLALVDSFINTK